MLDLSTISEIAKKLMQAREVGVNMVVVHKPNIEESQTSEAYPDVIACNFSDPKLAAALLRNEVDDAD